MNKKKQKTYNFHNEWEELYFFTMSKGKCLCLICRVTVALPKKGNLQRHFLTLHKNYENDYPVNTEFRKQKLKELKNQLTTQQLFLKKPIHQSKMATEASYAIAYVMAKHKKPYRDGEIFKEAFLEGSERLFSNFKNKSEILNAIKDLQLSRRTVTRRIEDINKNVTRQLEDDIQSCRFFSLQFDESTDIVDTAELIVFIRMIFSDFSIKEEFLTILPIKGKTRGADMMATFMSFAEKTNLPFHKLVAMSTDGAPAMIGKNNGFVALCKKNDQFPDFISFHCIIHNIALCAKILDANDIMDVAVKIANSIRAQSLRRSLFRSQLEENDSEYEDLLLFCHVRWLSRGNFLERFLNLLPEIITFLNTLGEKHEQLEDQVWVKKLAFLTDLIGHYNSLNLELQGKGKNIIDLHSSVNLFKSKLKHFASQLKKENFKNFPYLEKHNKLTDECNNNNTGECNEIIEMFCCELENFYQEFERRFENLNNFQPIFKFISFPFGEFDIEEIASIVAHSFHLNTSHLELEILTLQSDIFLNSRANEKHFWNIFQEEKYPLLKSVAMRIFSFFGSTYLCEAAFSQMKYIKSQFRSLISDDHLIASMRLCISDYKPDISKLADEMECHASTSKI